VSKKFELPWYYRQVPRDFMSSPDVEIMTCEEVGSYFLLLQKSWLGGDACTLPNDPARLAKLARVEKVSELVLSKFQLDKEGRLYNPRLMEEWKEALKRSKDAKNAVSARENKRNDRSTTDERPMNDRSTTDNRPMNDRLSTKYQDTIPNTKYQNQPKTMQAQVEVGSATDVALDSASRETRTPSESGARVAGKLAAILGRDNLKPGTKTAWAELAQALVDAHGEQKVLAVMQHHLVDSPNHFWRGRVMAMKNFARCFNSMLKQMNQNMVAGTRTAVDSLAARAASLQTGHDFSAMAKGDV
jgi:uncharacterized protein YdaU (DUF1376 family)